MCGVGDWGGGGPEETCIHLGRSELVPRPSNDRIHFDKSVFQILRTVDNIFLPHSSYIYIYWFFLQNTLRRRRRSWTPGRWCGTSAPSAASWRSSWRSAAPNAAATALPLPPPPSTPTAPPALTAPTPPRTCRPRPLTACLRRLPTTPWCTQPHCRRRTASQCSSSPCRYTASSVIHRSGRRTRHQQSQSCHGDSDR